MEIREGTPIAPDPPNGTWAPVLARIAEAGAAVARVEMRTRAESGGPGRMSARAIVITPGEGDDPDAIGVELLEAAEKAESDAGYPLTFSVTIYSVTDNGGARRDGPYRCHLRPSTVQGDAVNSTLEVTRALQRLAVSLIGHLERQARTQAETMERFSQVLAPMVQVKQIELEHERETAEREAAERAEERDWQLLELAARAVLKRWGIDLGGEGEAQGGKDPRPSDPEEQEQEQEPETTESGALRGDVVELDRWRRAQLDMRRAEQVAEVSAALRRARAVTAWRRAQNAETEREFRAALPELARRLRARPGAAAVILARAPYMRAHAEFFAGG